MIVSLIVVVLSAMGVYKLVTYKRMGSKYKPAPSFIAYIMTVALGVQAIDVVCNGKITEAWNAVLTAILVFLIFKSNGNVSDIVRSRHGNK